MKEILICDKCKCENEIEFKILKVGTGIMTYEGDDFHNTSINFIQDKRISIEFTCENEKCRHKNTVIKNLDEYKD